MAKTLKLKALKLNQSVSKDRERAIYNTSIKIKDLLDPTSFKINWWEPEKRGSDKQGYQRKPEEQRKRQILKYLVSKGVKNPIFPTNIVVSAHEPIDFHVIEGNFGEVILEGAPKWILDGQNRIEGFRYAVEDLNDGSLDNYEMPVTLLSNFDLYDELEQFYILNSTQKRVKTDLAQMLRKEIAKEVGNDNYKEVYGDIWDLKAIALTELIATKQESDMSNLWFARIRFPNTKKSISHLVNQNSFVTSLRPLYKGGILENDFSIDEAYLALKNYWSAISEIFPDSFAIPRDYVIQKTPGIFSLHDLANRVLSQLVNERKDWSKRNIEDKLKIAFQNEKKYNDDFWRADNYLGAAMAGSMKGFKRLGNDFKEALEEE